MKRYILLLFAAALLTACDNGDEQATGSVSPKRPILFPVENLVMPVTKSIVNAGTAGVFLQASNNLFDDRNISYTYDAGSHTLIPPTDKTRYWETGILSVNAWIYYPFDAANTDAAGIAINQISDQSTVEAYNKCDILYSTNTLVLSNDITSSFVFSHLMSRIVVNLTGNTANVTSVRIAHTITNGSADITQEVPYITLGGNIEQITPYKVSDTEYDAVIIPQDIKSTTDFIYVTTSSNNKTYKLSPSEDFSAGMGEQYTFTINID